MYIASVLFVIIFVWETFVNCKEMNDEIIVNEINHYRNDYVCTNAVRNLQQITSDELLVEQARSFMNKEITHNMDTSFTQITPDTCAYQPLNQSLENNVLRFIRKCISRTKLPGNYKVSWLFDPTQITIGCAYSSSSSNFVLCVVHKFVSNTAIFIDNSKYNTDLLKQNGSLFINMCPRIERNNKNFQSCYLLQSTRDYIMNEVNSFRNNFILPNRVNDLAQVEWDSALEMAAIELSKFQPVEWADCFTIPSHKNGFVVQEFVPNANFLLGPNLTSKIIKSIAESDNSTRDLYAIGCTYFLVSNKGALLCVWNKDKSMMTAVLRWISNLRYNFHINPYLVYIAIIIVFLNIIIIILFLRAVCNFRRQTTSRRSAVVESIYSKAQ